MTVPFDRPFDSCSRVKHASCLSACVEMDSNSKDGTCTRMNAKMHSQVNLKGHSNEIATSYPYNCEGIIEMIKHL